MNGVIFVWYHSEGIEPNWFPIKVPQIETEKWVYRGRTEHTISCHFQVFFLWGFIDFSKYQLKYVYTSYVNPVNIQI